MRLQSLHTHTIFCDGTGTPAQMADAAFAAGCTAIGFSGHAPLEGQDWAMEQLSIPEYRRQVLEQRDRYKGRMNVFLGLEQDFFSPSPEDQWDYLIGSVHGVFANGAVHWVDESEERFQRIVQEQFGGDIVALAREYYRLEAQIVQRTGCQIVGHFDLLTKFNEGDRLFDTSTRAYRHAALEALEAVLEQDAILEVNTGAMSRGCRKTPYPAPFLLQEIGRKKGRITLTADSHSPSTVVSGYRQALEILTHCGISSLWYLTPDGFQEDRFPQI
ncbi:histidinol-phosphatase HisJ family protein [uncultured Ruthenibacterium sp.]|uniref:histidinol-phosphatase HisJ family protein n=1 Tax=uncultured Ruthenibacterium sp. TaxID=1905347 RepID=UPI00349E6EF8